jgi:hypothetical protein
VGQHLFSIDLKWPTLGTAGLHTPRLATPPPPSPRSKTGRGRGVGGRGLSAVQMEGKMLKGRVQQRINYNHTTLLCFYFIFHTIHSFIHIHSSIG